MKMDIDLLKKLIRLANNNPNENEANSAARKVCDLLKDEDWKSYIPNKQTEFNWQDYLKMMQDSIYNIPQVPCLKCFRYYPIGTQHICS